MNITKFNEKLNKLEGNTYTIEEVATPVNGVYEADLRHDNVEPNTINVYTGSKLTGDKINSYTISTPSLTPWRTHIKIYSSIFPLYITYETIGDTVEADDINNVQNAVNDTQNALNAGLSNKADKSHTHTKSQITDMPTKLSQFINDSGFITSADVDGSQNHVHANKAVLDKITQHSLDSWNSKFDKTGGVVTGKALFKQGTGVIKLSGGSGTAGFMHIAQIKISGNYQNQPITFSIHQRNGIYGMLVILFRSVNGIDPDLQNIHKIGNINAYIYKSDTSTWELYLQKVEAYDCIDIIGFNKGEYMSGTAVTWTNETIAELPSGSIQAITEYLNVNVAKATQDSDGKQINTTYVKKGMTWAELEGK